MTTGARTAELFARLLRTRPLVRAPLLLYRAGLGAVFGSRMLRLEHVGRRSGRTRYVVLEVVGRTGPARHVVASGFGERAQWFRNVTAEPRVRVSVGRRRSVPARARILSPAEGGEVLARYIAAGGNRWAWFGQVLERTLERPVGADDPPPMVELTLEA